MLEDAMRQLTYAVEIMDGRVEELGRKKSYVINGESKEKWAEVEDDTG